MTGGPMFDRIEAVLAGLPGLVTVRRGALDPAGRAAILDGARAALLAGGVPDEDVDYAKRYPADRDRFVADCLARLKRAGVIARDDWPPAVSADADARAARFVHDGRTTYIYPEEFALLAALAAIVRPRRALFLGSYYGYWAAAALPGILAGGGVAVLVDPDPECCALAARNLAGDIWTGGVILARATGEDMLAADNHLYDMVVIDAEQPRDHADPAQRGKGVYASLLAAALPRMTDGAILVCHNILLEDRSGAPVFKAILARNRRELGPFGALVRAHFPGWTEFASTEGVGVGRLAAAART